MPGIDIPRMGLPDRLAARLSMAEQHEILLRRRTLLAAAAGAAAAAVTGGGPAFARSQTPPGRMVVPFGRHLAWGANPRTQMRVGWQTPYRVHRPYVRIGDQPWNLGEKVPAELRALHSEIDDVVAPIDQYYLHAELDGLTPGTTYYYAVGHAGYDPTDIADFGRIDSFTTAPSRRRVAEPFTFTAFGDQGVSVHALRNDGMVAAQRPAFHLHAGDLCYADQTGRASTSDVYDPGTWDEFLLQTEPIAASVPWMPCFGNHDMEAMYSHDGYGGQKARWSFPDNGPEKGIYSFIYGNVGVVALDANDVCFERDHNRGYTGGAQTRWLDQRLTFLRAQSDVDFVVVFFHHCAFSTTTAHASEGGVRSLWVPLFDKYQVDLVINGHNHVYERTDAIRGGVPTTTPIGGTVHPDRHGTVYVTAGAGGRDLYRFAAPDSYAGHERETEEIRSYVWAAGRERVAEKVSWSRVRYTGYSFVAVDSQPAADGRTSTLTVRAVTERGQEIDRVVIARPSTAAGRLHLGDDVA
ncbi:purple acid phosphatase family protein [Actinoplanes sp. CA-030573]|uniref:purple acid phosphatase family protein n=1 Tax=Actinoplanes sp. CA-030573 TaxID=3239898 RepID=UPI003D89D46B